MEMIICRLTVNVFKPETSESRNERVLVEALLSACAFSRFFLSCLLQSSVIVTKDDCMNA